jgi:hypothetical protein
MFTEIINFSRTSSSKSFKFPFKKAQSWRSWVTKSTDKFIVAELVRATRTYMEFSVHHRVYKILSLDPVTQLVKEFTALYRIRKLVTVFTTARHWFLSWASWIQSTHTQTISLRSILILSFHLRLGLLSTIFISGFPTKILYTCNLIHACYMNRSSNPPWFDDPKCSVKRTSSSSFLKSVLISSFHLRPSLPNEVFIWFHQP